MTCVIKAGVLFPKNDYSILAHLEEDQYPLNTTRIAGDSITNGIRGERLSGKYGVVKVRNFPGATIEDMQHNLVPILERNHCRLILHVGTNNTESCTSREILDKLPKLKPSSVKSVLDVKPSFQTSISDEVKAKLTVSHLTNHLLQLKKLTIETLQIIVLVEKGEDVQVLVT